MSSIETGSSRQTDTGAKTVSNLTKNLMSSSNSGASSYDELNENRHHHHHHHQLQLIMQQDEYQDQQELQELQQHDHPQHGQHQAEQHLYSIELASQFSAQPAPPSYSASVYSNNNKFIPSKSGEYYRHTPNVSSLPMQSSFSGSYQPNDYIPSSHNTPTAISTSYSSNHSSYAPVLNTQQQQQQQQQSFQPNASQNLFTNVSGGSGSASFKPATTNFMPQPSMATTNISMDSANSNNSILSTSASSNMSLSFVSNPHVVHTPVNPYQRSSLSSSIPFTSSLGQPPGQGRPSINRMPSIGDQTIGGTSLSLTSTPPTFNHHNAAHSLPTTSSFIPQHHQTIPALPPQATHLAKLNNHHHHNQSPDLASNLPYNPSPEVPPFVYNPEPDHYMTYSEFLVNVSLKDQTNSATGEGEEHLNIVEYPVEDLILMLSCLLTKIIEANDKLHPNHFDKTIAHRQRLKEERRIRRLNRMNGTTTNRESGNEPGIVDEDFDFDNSNNNNYNNNNDSDDEENEMENKYLANVLAFHGTNIPTITLHAYLTRVLKYCPVTNEVFLSLLVYFDRIAKKANNLKKKDVNNNNNGNNSGDKDNNEMEQLFVMDSYNIHRLIISGITVSSKFFSDIFYKNLRYAKVGGLPLEELNYLELQFLLLLDFKLMILVEDLQNYADLLLRFWKREQMAKQLTHVQQLQDQLQQMQQLQQEAGTQ